MVAVPRVDRGSNLLGDKGREESEKKEESKLGMPQVSQVHVMLLFARAWKL